jgi:hypothetical protein
MNHRSDEYDDTWGNQEGERETSNQKASGGNAQEARARYTIDRFEDQSWVVLEDEEGESFPVPAVWLPDEASEGDLVKLSLRGEGDTRELRFTLDPEARERRLRAVKALRGRLPKGPSGDIEL